MAWAALRGGKGAQPRRGRARRRAGPYINSCGAPPRRGGSASPPRRTMKRYGHERVWLGGKGAQPRRGGSASPPQGPGTVLRARAAGRVVAAMVALEGPPLGLRRPRREGGQGGRGAKGGGEPRREGGTSLAREVSRKTWRRMLSACTCAANHGGLSRPRPAPPHPHGPHIPARPHTPRCCSRTADRLGSESLTRIPETRIQFSI